MKDFLKKLNNQLRSPIEINKGKWLAIGLLSLVLVSFFLVLPLPLMQSSVEAYDHMRSSLFRLERLSRTLSEKKPLTELRDTLKNQNHSDESFLPTAPFSLASAELQNEIKQTITDADGELTSTQVIPEHTEDQFTKVGIKVHMNGSTLVLRKVLYSLEANKPFLFIENINIRPIRPPKPPNGQPQASADKLGIDFDVVGFMRVH